MGRRVDRRDADGGNLGRIMARDVGRGVGEGFFEDDDDDGERHGRWIAPGGRQGRW